MMMIMMVAPVVLFLCCITCSPCELSVATAIKVAKKEAPGRVATVLPVMEI